MSKKKYQNEKERHANLIIDVHHASSIHLTGAPIQISGTEIRSDNLVLEFSPELMKRMEGGENQTTRDYYYNRDIQNPEKRKDPKKTVTQITVPGVSASLDEMQLFDYYDYIFVMDTNNKPLNSEKVCIGMVGQLLKDTSSGQIALRKLCNYSFKLPDKSDVNPEIITWCKFIELLQTKAGTDKRIALIVDSELSELPKYNRGEPILEDFILPRNMTFIYASADKNDTVLNWAIKQCDSAASKALKAIISS